MIYITSATTTTLGKVYGIRVEVNKATTGTLTIADGGATIAVIAASTAVTSKEYWGFNGSVTVTNSATEDVTINILNTPR